MKSLPLLFLAVPLFAAEPLPSGPGLAAKYPGDAGIEKDPKVVQAERFELPDIAALAGQWKSEGANETMSFTADVPAGSGGGQALWIDGKLVTHPGKGFPEGRWTFDKFEPGKSGDGVRWSDEKKDREYFKVPEGGAPFDDYRWRTVPELNVNYVWLYNYVTEPGHVRVWYDDVVVPTDYIGPLTAKK